MKLLDTIFHLLAGSPVRPCVTDLNARLLNAWVLHQSIEYLHPQCTWQLGEGHILQGAYKGNDFYQWYTQQLDARYATWTEAIESVISSEIGGIIVGEYQFQKEIDGLWQTAPFTHFYRIENEQITSVRMYMGAISSHLDAGNQLIEIASIQYFLSAN
ncbi:nuclear transport factor 2 family protein [Spirosoma endbachense]|uniref:Nuclear transport factor 2 family protein n=1 Tax=Spirosoma endbachense TaxID=2666025 RepID=A0A6P1W5J4_9BACT|nr:nuclear transport factor 2 family protein [Spirosoma endbachense]QHW00165.1 nuclear transport factor 2 family protein [Spirosoma endbachense]